MPANAAAWQPVKRGKLDVASAPYPSAREGEMVVATRAVAINPVDWILQVAGGLLFTWIKYPFILGSDLAGDVVEVGSGVTRFKIGDRVLAHGLSTDPKCNRSAEGAFQSFAVVRASLASPIPDAMSYENACVLPLGLSTAACGLFQKDQLGLSYPSLDPKPTGQTLLVWGGATSVGSNAIQLGVAAGYDVVTTASPRNFDYVKRLGASQAFDYKSKTVVKDVVAALKGKTIAGALAVGATSASACLDIVHACQGAKFVAMASFPISLADLAEGGFVTARFFAKVPAMLAPNASLWLRSRIRGVRTNFIFGSSLAYNEVGKLIYEDFLPAALAQGRYIAAPEPQVVGKGLEAIQAGFDMQRKGMSARKVVVSL